MIRGAIAFGLVLKIDGTKVPESEVIVTTSLALVLITTVVFGGTMPLVQKWLVPPLEEEKHEYDEKEEEVKVEQHSEHEEFLHPNLV